MLRIANFQLNVKYVYSSPIVPRYFASKRDFATDGLVLMAHTHTHKTKKENTSFTGSVSKCCKFL